MAGSHEMRGVVIFKQQDSTRNLIQFSIALLIKNSVAQSLRPP